MTDDERRDGEGTDDDVASRIDPRTRWGDPEARWGNPETDLPNVPRVRIPGEDASDEGDGDAGEAPEFTADLDPEQTRLFWASVVLANLGIAGLAVGAMLVYFRGQLLVGGGAMVLGAVALSRVYVLYREYQSHDWSSDDDDDEDDAERPDTDRRDEGEESGPGANDGTAPEENGASTPEENGASTPEENGASTPDERNR